MAVMSADNDTERSEDGKYHFEMKESYSFIFNSACCWRS